jgi:hypothetical protein
MPRSCRIKDSPRNLRVNEFDALGVILRKRFDPVYLIKPDGTGRSGVAIAASQTLCGTWRVGKLHRVSVFHLL